MQDDLAQSGSAESQTTAPNGAVAAPQGATVEGQPNQEADRQDAAVGEAREAAEQERSQRPRSRRDARINEITREKNEFRRQAEFYRGQYEELASKQMKPLDPVKHRTDDEWAAAIAENTSIKSQEGFAKSQAEINERRANELEDQLWRERADSYSSIVPDFHQVVNAVKVDVPGHVLQMIRGMENGPPAAYYLAKKPAELLRISRLNPMDAAFELGRLDRQLTATKPKTVSSAPPPPATVRGRSAGNATPVDKMNPQQYAAWKKSKGLPS